MKTSQEIRKQFLEFFKSKQHLIVPSAPMVVKDDPTLMFINSGMAPFKEYFLGNGKPKSNRIADTQKCLRISGKHNDLEEVGMDTYHHTMFEMLGNWSFGDYFKEDAIKWAWELLTEVYNIDKDIFYVTIFEGDESEGLERDSEAYNIWKKYVPEERILNGNKNDNFWEMGEQGPCGPCSEIHVDIRSEEEKRKIPGNKLVNMDHPQVVEVWNLVFMQFNRKANGSLEKLPAQHVDTGMGFERLCTVLQNKKSNYDTDVFTPLIREIGAITKTEYGKDEKIDIATRVIADHIRAVAFSIADGQLPSNTGAGYVIRRILRRAVRYGYSFLDLKEPFLYQLLDALIESLGSTFGELEAQRNIIEKVILEEEQSFLRTLDKGIQLFENYTAKANKVIGRAFAFELYDTYGFPIDLTCLLAEEKDLEVDLASFETKLKEQQDRSRAAGKISTDDWVVLKEDDKEEFVGYDQNTANVQITRYRKIEQKNKELYQLVFNLSPFYPEGGGQVGDTGYITQGGDKTVIVDTKKENNLIVHFCKDLPLNLEGNFEAVVNIEKRQQAAVNHSATHLLHQALRSVLGNHIEQKGSLVHPEYLRFDFSHFQKVSGEDLEKVEDFVNAKIQENLQLEEDRNLPIDEAKNRGAVALFGEKYGDTVRVIQFGKSIELCGGTHVKATGEIGFFTIVSESAVAAGVRRIEAYSGVGALGLFKKQRSTLTTIAEQFKQPKSLTQAIENLLNEKQQLQKELEQLKIKAAANAKVELLAKVKKQNGINVLIEEVALDAGLIKNIAFQLKAEVKDLFMVLVSNAGGKPTISVLLSENLVKEKELNASQIVRELAKHIQGGGGGQAFFATAGGKRSDGIPAVLKAAKHIVT